MKMVNLKISTETFENSKGESETRDEYPYGLTLYLDNETLEKLGATIPDVGESIELSGIAKIKSKRTDEREGKKTTSVDLQITDLALGSGDAKSAADVLFDGGE
ncbi:MULTISPECIES: capsid staple protein [Providencia]|uniref:capsid staple protein n=1 Tax=Providencia TaxID=586 RepID=UPI001C5BC478|nr:MULTISPECIES: hypothetical protein [unclassified Providencia]QXX83896.1 hypothetical protein J6836_05820 [Providencia sp. R33]